MPRYAQQIGRTSCGPTAIANVLKWVGVKLNYKRDRRQLMKDCCCTSLYGTSFARFNYVLRHYAEQVGFTVRRKYKPKLADIDRHLKCGGIAAICYEHQYGRHYALIVAGDGKRYDMVNAFRGAPAVDKDRTRWELKHRVLYYRKSTYPFKLWLISKD
jgi:predicted secreted Zn-dependent protease